MITKASRSIHAPLTLSFLSFQTTIEMNNAIWFKFNLLYAIRLLSWEYFPKISRMSLEIYPPLGLIFSLFSGYRKSSWEILSHCDNFFPAILQIGALLRVNLLRTSLLFLAPFHYAKLLPEYHPKSLKGDGLFAKKSTHSESIRGKNGKECKFSWRIYCHSPI